MWEREREKLTIRVFFFSKKLKIPWKNPEFRKREREKKKHEKRRQETRSLINRA